jgi:hypothetical protein
MGRPCMLLVVEMLTKGEIITIFVLCFNVLFKYTLHLLNFECTRSSTGLSTRLKCNLVEDLRPGVWMVVAVSHEAKYCEREDGAAPKGERRV